MLLRWLLFYLVSFACLTVFNWCFYTALDNGNAHSENIPRLFASGFVWSLIIAGVMIIPIAFAIPVSSLALNVWFGHNPFILYFGFAAASLSSIILVYWYKFSVLPTRWDLMGLAVIICTSLAVLYLNTHHN